MELTVVVCTHNRSSLLARLLESLFDARRPERDQIEILLIANACSDDTRAVMQRWERKATAEPALSLRWTEEPAKGKSNALNLALTLLRGDAAVLVDDDHRVDADFLVNIAQCLHTHPHANILCGRILPDWDGTEPEWVHERGPYRLYPYPVPMFDAGDEKKDLTRESFKPGGGNLIFRLPLLQSLGRFSTDLGPRGHDLGGGEDSEFLKRALDRGERLLYLPDILQYHYVDVSRLRLPHLLRLSYQRSRASARIHRDSGSGAPLYVWRKLSEYLLSALFSLDANRSRFYLVRSAAALGEIRGVTEEDDRKG
jgi:glycosyltransferase involved in cell wall biosynthesis